MAVQVATSDLEREKSNEDVYGTALGLAEIGIGSLLHAFFIPFSGMFLSLNQIFLLTCSLSQASSEDRSWTPFFISVKASLVKCLAPIGKKLTPMLAICMQGLLYNLGILCFGNTLWGRLIGGILSSLWGFCQPLLLYRLFFGSSFFEVIESFSWAVGLFWGLVLFKITLASLIIVATPLLPTRWLEQYLQRVSNIATSQSAPKADRHPLQQALRDLCKPLFLFSLLLTAFFFYFSEGVSNALIWGILRPLGVGYVFFFLLRILPIKQWAKHGS